MLDRSLIDRKIHDSVMETCFESIVTRAFIGAVPIERSQLSAGLTQGLEGYVSDCLKDLGGVRLLQKAIESEQDPNRKLYLSRIWEICNESANSVVDRVVEENKDDEALKDAAEKVAMTDEEVAKFAKKADDLVPDELVRIIQQKTLDTIKEEKAAYQKDAELEAEISNALNVADDEEESSEPDSPGDEDGNPVGGSNEGAPKAMTQQENGAKSGEQIGTDASESWSAATESKIGDAIKALGNKLGHIFSPKNGTVKSVDGTPFQPCRNPESVCVFKVSDAEEFYKKAGSSKDEMNKAFIEELGYAANKAMAAYQADFITMRGTFNPDYISFVVSKPGNNQAFGEIKPVYGPMFWCMFRGAINVGILGEASKGFYASFRKDKDGSIDYNLRTVRNEKFGQKEIDAFLNDVFESPANESDTSTGDTGHFNDVNNDKASNVCKIDSRENITSEADEIMKDKIMVDAEKQNDAEAKKEVGEGGKVFESWSALLSAYETEVEEAAQEANIFQAIHHAFRSNKPSVGSMQTMQGKSVKELLPYVLKYHDPKFAGSSKYVYLKGNANLVDAALALLKKANAKCHKETVDGYVMIVFDSDQKLQDSILDAAIDGSASDLSDVRSGNDYDVKKGDFIIPWQSRKGPTLNYEEYELAVKTAAYMLDQENKATKATESDEGFQTEADPKEDEPPQTGCSHAFVEGQNDATKEDQKCSPIGEQIGQECPCEEKASPKVDNPKAMEAYMHMIAGPNPRPKHATVFSKIQELAYEGICATREQYSGIPFETMAAITKENTFPAFESNCHRGPHQRIDNVARYAFESLATPDEPVAQQENLETSLLTASVIYTFFETLSTMNLYSPKLAEIRKFVDETLPLEQKTIGDKRLLEDAIRSVINDIKTKCSHARSVPEVDEARNDLQIVRERIGMPGFESVRSKAEAMIKDAQESIDARNDHLVAAMRPVQAAVESSTALMLRTRDTLKFDRVANLMGRKPNVMTVKAKIDPQGKSKYVAIECYTVDNRPAGTSTVVLEGAIESLVDYVTTAVKSSKLMGLNKHIVVSDSRNAKIYLDNAN